MKRYAGLYYNDIEVEIKNSTITITKYKAIRCLKDNRLEDGQIVQIDQCLTCTRFEPIIGNCYEILNDKGSNLCQIMDDNQMSYSNMQEYTKFVHTDQYSEQLKDYTAGASGIKTRNSADKDFKDTWSQGIKMDWKLVPVEKQKPHIGWRQSINDDGSSLKSHKLSSYQYSPENNGTAFGKSSTKVNVWVENKNAMDSNFDSTISQAIASGKTYASDAIQDTVNGMSAKGWMKSVKQQCSSSSVKLMSVALGCLAIADNKGGDINSVVSTIAQIESSLSADNIDNQIITATCYAIPDGLQYFLSTGSKCIYKTDNKNDNTSSSTNTTLNKTNINSWKWTEFAPYLAKMNVSGLDMTPKICYTYEALNKYANDAVTAIQEFMANYDGSPMANGAEGCCEAATKIGAGYSEFLKAELAKGVVYCPTLESDAQAAGVPIVDFDPSQLEAGDVIMYTNQEHVVIATGNGTEYVGNSSSRLRIVQGADYNEMGWDPPIYPVRIIKTSQA